MPDFVIYPQADGAAGQNTGLADRQDGADLFVGANGAFSWLRNQNEDRLGTETDLRRNRFIWHGARKA